MIDRYSKLNAELVDIANEIDNYYNLKTVKTYAVYVNDKNTGKNVFDIHARKVILHDIEHIIEKESKPIIIRIQEKLKDIEIEETKHHY